MKRKYIAVIQAGGKGTRMESLTKNRIPKPMLLINGKPMLEWQIENIRDYGIKDIIIIVGHLGEIIEDYFANGKRLGVNISYITEKEPLGSAGSLGLINELVENAIVPQYTDVLLVFGDVMFRIDWNRMIQFHEKKNSKATLLVHPNSHPYDSDLVRMDEEKRIIGIDSKTNKRDYWYDNCVNAGLYILSKQLIDRIPQTIDKCDLEQDILRKLVCDNDAVYGYRTSEYVKDAGTPERYAMVCKEQSKGMWDSRCLDKKQKCIFLDRDGTLNVYKGLISTADQIELEQNVAEALRMINESGYLAILITNQPVVARGMCSINTVNIMHNKLQVLLGKNGAYLDDIAFCPHHPDKGYPEEDVQYKIKCNCRKPDIGLIKEMTNKYNIDLSKSWIIGDSTVDIQTGINAHMHTILVETGVAGKDGKYEVQADFISKNLKEAVEKIVGGR